jgi:K+-transporting ATPase ATPase C chain
MSKSQNSNTHLSFGKSLKQAARLFIFLFIIIGIIYPFSVFLISNFFWPEQANGQTVKLSDLPETQRNALKKLHPNLNKNSPIGSLLIAQNFTHSCLFWGRPSEAYVHNQVLVSNASNLALSDKKLQDKILERSKIWLQNQPKEAANKPIPIDLITASASGLDPNISYQGALYQIDRLVQNCPFEKKSLINTIDAHTHKKFFSLNKESFVNVFELNISLLNQYPNLIFHTKQNQ